MSEAQALTCPSCGGDITTEQLARDGACPVCMDREFNTRPAGGEESPTSHQAAPDGGPPSSTGGEPEGNGGPPDEAAEALAYCLGALVAIRDAATDANAYSWKLPGDELCNVFGQAFDRFIAESSGILSVLLDEGDEIAAGS